MKLITFSLFSLIGTSQAAAQAVNVSIKNPSFEDVVPAQYQRACGIYTYEVPPGWTSTTGAAVAILAPTSPRPCDFSNPPDGKQMLLVQNGTVSQDLGDIYTILPHDAHGEVNGFYTVHFFVANYFYWYDGKFSASLSLVPNSSPYSSKQTITLCKTSGWAMGDFVDVTFTCTAQRRYGELFITLASGSGTGEPYGNGYENLFDNVSLTFTPTN